jgi:hypothetical protein
MDKLVCIVTGPEHNGTTYLKNILDSHPDIFSGFETGILVDNDFTKCDPWNEWIFLGQYHWGIPKNIDFTNNSLTIQEKFTILFQNKGNYEGNNQKLIKNSKYIIDKTPKYFRIISKVYEKINNYNIPIIITIKYFKDNYISFVKKRSTRLEDFILLINQFIDSLIWFKNNKSKIKNIYLFRYQDIIKPEFINNLKNIIKNRIDINYELSVENYYNKLEKYNIKNRPYHNWVSKDKFDLNNDTFYIKCKELETKFDNLIDTLKESL